MRVLLPLVLSILVQGRSDGIKFKVKNIDAALFKDAEVALIRYVPWSVQRWKAEDLQKWADGSSASPEWAPLIKPVKEFTPIGVFPGQFKNTLVLELGSKALWQLDSDFQVLTRLNIPEEIAETELKELQIFWSPQQRILFVNTGRGVVYQTVERSGKLEVLRRDRIPLSSRNCYPARWAAFSPAKAAYLCLGDSSGWFFDSFFGKLQSANPDSLFAPGPPGKAEVKNRTALYAEGGRSLLVRRYVSRLFCFRPQSGEFSYCPDFLK